MAPDEERAALRTLNEQVGPAEDRFDVAFFDTHLAEAFIMRRTNGKIANKDAFLGKLEDDRELIESGAPAPPPRETGPVAVTLYGRLRAIAECEVTTTEGRSHNLRLLIRSSPDAPWQFLAWANELVDSSEAPPTRQHPEQHRNGG